jgi:predicted RNA-binding Zn-ribbon protein involved in translation (DUF1610 family)
VNDTPADTTPAEPELERRCQVCHRNAVTVDGRGTDQTCATCLGRTRQHIVRLEIMATALLGEALLRTLNSEAAALAGPVADVEVWSYRRLSVLGQRIDPSWLEDQVDMHHPSWVLGTWEREARLHFGQVVSPGTSKPTLTEAVEFLLGDDGRTLARLAQDPDFAFGELANDMRICHDHVERVLALEDHVDRGAPCPNCGQAELRKDYGTDESDDMWTCPRCLQWWTDHDYRTRILAVYVGVAEALTASQIAEHYRVKESTIRTWVERGRVHRRGKDAQGRQLYDVAEVLACRDEPHTPLAAG